jgi:hypothetical protein
MSLIAPGQSPALQVAGANAAGQSPALNVDFGKVLKCYNRYTFTNA